MVFIFTALACFPYSTPCHMLFTFRALQYSFHFQYPNIGYSYSVPYHMLFIFSALPNSVPCHMLFIFSHIQCPAICYSFCSSRWVPCYMLFIFKHPIINYSYSASHYKLFMFSIIGYSYSAPYYKLFIFGTLLQAIHIQHPIISYLCSAL